MRTRLDRRVPDPVHPSCLTHPSAPPRTQCLTQCHPCDVSHVRLVQVRLIFRLQRATTEPPADDATARSAITFVPLRARLVEVLDEAAERVVRDELLALELDARLGRGVVVLEPLLDGAALVGEAVGLVC